jgi:hypothetical protein
VTEVAGNEATVVPENAKKQKSVVPTNSPTKAIASENDREEGRQGRKEVKVNREREIEISDVL